MSGTIDAETHHGMLPKRILVVDDDRSILRLVATILRRELYQVDTANSGNEALSRIELTLYDVIVLDLMMPEVSGFDVLKAIHLRVPETPCVVVMSAASSFDIANAINPNVFATLSKPFDNAHLIDIVRKCSEGSCHRDAPGLTGQPVEATA
jgi:DNA-binding NtrC family response regulator